MNCSILKALPNGRSEMKLENRSAAILAKFLTKTHLKQKLIALGMLSSLHDFQTCKKKKTSFQVLKWHL